MADQLYALPVERALFEQIEQKRFSITELRRDLNDQLKKLKSIQDLVNKAGNQHMARLTQQQQTVADLERQIRSETDQLYAMHLQWQVRLFPSMFAAASASFEIKLHDLARDVKTERDKDRKHRDEFESKAYSHYGQSNKFQSDITRIKSDLSALTKDHDRLRTDLADKHKDLRKDLDADVSHIKDSRERIKRLEKDLAAVQDKSAKPSAATSSVVSNSVRAASSAPSSPGTAHAAPFHATSSVQDPRPRPAPQPNPASATASPLDATSTQTTTQNATPIASTSARTSEAVTQAQFRKWVRDHQQDLELQFDEVRERAVQEATAEIQACMEDRLRSLARKWKTKALQGEDAEAAANADGTTPMDVERASEQNQPVPRAATANGPQTASATVVQTDQDKSVTQTHSQPGSAELKEGTAAPTTTSQAVTADGSASETSKNDTSHVSATQPATVSPLATVSPPTTPSVDGAAQASVVKSNGSCKEFTVIPKEALRNIGTTLKGHDTQLGAVKQDIDALRKLQNESFDKMLQSPGKIKQLLEALNQNGLDEFATALRDTVAQLQPAAVQVQTDFDAVRTSQQSVRDQIQALEEWKQQFIVAVNGRVDWLQKQFEMLDDQSSLQGALLVKLCEHANPRRPPPASASVPAGAAPQASPGVQSPAVRSPLVQHAQRPPSSASGASVPRQSPRHVSALANAMRPQAGMDAAATALSAHMQPPVYANQLHPYQQVPPQPQHHHHHPQPQDHQACSVPRLTYQYQDPNQRQGYH